MRVAVIRSIPLERGDGPEREGGYYTLTVNVHMSEAVATGDPAGFIRKEVARHLAGCVKDTGIPLGEKVWQVTFTKFMQNNFNLPEGFIV